MVFLFAIFFSSDDIDDEIDDEEDNHQYDSDENHRDEDNYWDDLKENGISL